MRGLDSVLIVVLKIICLTPQKCMKLCFLKDLDHKKFFCSIKITICHGGFANIYSANLKWPISNYNNHLNINDKIIATQAMSEYFLHFREHGWSSLFGPYSCHHLHESKENNREFCLVKEKITDNQWESLQMKKWIIQPETWPEFAYVTLVFSGNIYLLFQNSPLQLRPEWIQHKWVVSNCKLDVGFCK